jgi:pimeloyl-ACP methyl ester carboxylesterase
MDATLAIPDREGSSIAATTSLLGAVAAGVAGHRPGPWQTLVPTLSLRHAFRDRSPGEILAWWRGRLGPPPWDVNLYVHGLLIDERNWQLGAHDLPAEVLRRAGHVPLQVRYNTGLRVSTNGALLADLIEEIVGVWGPALRALHLVGHSMGGLVCRSALAALQIRNSGAVERVRSLHLLATPNHGASLERIVASAEQSLRALRIPAAHASAAGPRRGRAALASSARLLEAAAGLRSDGIRDLRWGYLLDRDWNDGREGVARAPLPPPPHVVTSAIGAAIRTGDGVAPSVGRGDGLVSTASAAGLGPFDDLGVLSSGRWTEIDRLVHQAVPGSRRVRDALLRTLDDVRARR